MPAVPVEQARLSCPPSAVSGPLFWSPTVGTVATISPDYCPAAAAFIGNYIELKERLAQVRECLQATLRYTGAPLPLSGGARVPGKSILLTKPCHRHWLHSYQYKCVGTLQLEYRGALDSIVVEAL
jgi:hypothetical protein